MSANDINAETVTAILQALRKAAPPPASPLLSLGLVSRALDERGLVDSPPARFLLLADILRRLVWDELARLRPRTEHVDQVDGITGDTELRLLEADCRSGNDDRAAWGVVYIQYLGINRMPLTSLTRRGIPYHTFRRRRLRGCALLAARLLQQEVRSGNSTPPRRHAGPSPPAERLPTDPKPHAVDAGPIDHVHRDHSTARSGEGRRSQLPTARRGPLVGLLVLAGIVVTAGSRFGSPVAGLGSSPPNSPNKIAVIGPVAVSPARPRAGDTVTVSFQVRNSDSRPHTLTHLRAGGRGPRACAHVWSSPNVDFPDVANLHLSPGELFTYRASRVLSTPGDYFVEPVQVGASGRWGGVGPSPRAWFGVTDPDSGAGPAPDCLTLVQGPELQPLSPRVGEPFTVTFRIMNNSNDVLHLQKLMVGSRDPALTQLAWRAPTVFMPTERDLTLEPGETYLYRKSRFAREAEAGRHLIAPAVRQDGAWSGVWPFEYAWVTILPR